VAIEDGTRVRIGIDVRLTRRRVDMSSWKESAHKRKDEQDCKKCFNGKEKPNGTWGPKW
jgi:hypothetical protein